MANLNHKSRGFIYKKIVEGRMELSKLSDKQLFARYGIDDMSIVNSIIDLEYPLPKLSELNKICGNHGKLREIIEQRENCNCGRIEYLYITKSLDESLIRRQGYIPIRDDENGGFYYFVVYKEVSEFVKPEPKPEIPPSVKKKRIDATVKWEKSRGMPASMETKLWHQSCAKNAEDVKIESFLQSNLESSWNNYILNKTMENLILKRQAEKDLTDFRVKVISEREASDTERIRALDFASELRCSENLKAYHEYLKYEVIALRAEELNLKSAKRDNAIAYREFKKYWKFLQRPIVKPKGFIKIDYSEDVNHGEVMKIAARTKGKPQALLNKRNKKG